MKTKLNILCVLMFVAIAAVIGGATYEHGERFFQGVRDGMKDGVSVYVPDSTFVVENRRLFSMDLKPNNYDLCTDSVYNAKTGEWLPAQFEAVAVEMEEEDAPWWRKVVVSFCVGIITGAVMLQIVVFCQLIYTINKSIIFEWENVFKLRLIGWGIIAYFLANALYVYIDHQAIISIVDIPNYKIVTGEIWDFYQLILGLGVLLIAEIFAIGLRLREEQELTI